MTISRLLYYLQPSFLKVNESESIAEDLRGKYVVCLPLPNTKDEFGEITTKSISGIPAVMILIDSIIDEIQYDVFLNFILTVHNDPLKVFEGVQDFYPGEDYYITESFYKKFYNPGQYPLFEENLIPDYCTFGGDVVFNSGYYSLGALLNNIKDFNNLDYFNKLNIAHDNTYTKEELDSFYSTFCKVILTDTDFTPIEKIDIMYKKVLNYYKNRCVDETTENLSLFSVSASSNTNTSSCSCNQTNYNYNALGQSTSSTTNCLSSYTSSLYEYLKVMLSDVNFYKNFFFLHNIDVNSIENVNEILVNNLIKLINEFLELGYNLDFSSKTNSFECPTVNVNDDTKNKAIINNYLKVLDYVKENKIDENTNKIKIYGGQFAELLPQLDF